MSFVVSIMCLVISGIAAFFKFNLTSLLIPDDSGAKTTFFNIYFFSKMIFIICLTVMNFYLIFAFILRIDVEYIQLPDQQKAFVEGRLELSSQQRVVSTLSVNLVLVLVCQFHTLQNFYWLKLKSLSWEDLVNKVQHGIEEDNDDSFD